MRLPGKVKKGDLVDADDFNALIDFVQSLVVKPGRGYFARRSAGGTVLEMRPRSGGRGGGRIPSFTVLSAKWNATAGKFLVKLQPGYVWEGDPRSGTDIDVDHMPGVDDGQGGLTPLDAEDAPTIEADAGDYIFIKTDLTKPGRVDGTPEALADSTDQDGVQYKPDAPEEAGGVEGEHWRKVAQLVAVPGNAEKVTIDQYHTGDIELWPVVWEASHPAGAGQGAYHQYDLVNGKHEFRSHDMVYGHEVTRSGSLIEHAFDGENLPGTGMYADVYKTRADTEAAGDDKAQFRTITQGDSADRQQIEIVQDGDKVRIQGNDVTELIRIREGEPGSYTYTNFLDIEDGLVKSAADLFQEVELKVCKPGATASDPPTEETYRFICMR